MLKRAWWGRLPTMVRAREHCKINMLSVDIHRVLTITHAMKPRRPLMPAPIADLKVSGFGRMAVGIVEAGP